MAIAVNRNLSIAKIARKKVFRGFNWIRTRGLSVSAAVLSPAEHCSANAEATGSNPVEALKNFFSGYFRNCLNCDSLRWSHTHFICIPAVHIISFSEEQILSQTCFLFKGAVSQRFGIISITQKCFYFNRNRKKWSNFVINTTPVYQNC